MYFVIKDLALIDPMYQSSLTYVKKLFNDALANSEPSSDIVKRTLILIDAITETLYINICRGLFESHKLLYSFLICTSIKRQASEINETAWTFLLRGAGIYNKAAQPLRPTAIASLVSEGAWDLAYCMQQSLPDSFNGLCDMITQYNKIWEKYVLQDTSGSLVDLPCGYGVS